MHNSSFSKRLQPGERNSSNKEKGGKFEAHSEDSEESESSPSESSQHSQNEAYIRSKVARLRFDVSEEAKTLVRATFDLLRSSSSDFRGFALKFYPRLFQVNPSAQRLFEAEELANQASALTRMMTWIVSHLDEINNLRPVLQQMGGRHSIYGVQPEEYASFATTMAETLQAILGKVQFPDDAYKAWQDVISQIGQSTPIDDVCLVLFFHFQSWQLPPPR